MEITAGFLLLQPAAASMEMIDMKMVLRHFMEPDSINGVTTGKDASIN